MKIKSSARHKGVIAIVTLAFVIASMGIFARYLNAEFTILQQTYLRIFLAFILGITFFYKDIHFKKIKKISLKEWTIIIFRSITMHLLGVTLVSEAYVTAKYSNASFISVLPITAVLGFIFLREKFTYSKLIYILIGFLGVMLIAVKDYMQIFSWGTGEIFALLSSIFFGFNYIARKWQSDLLNNKEISVLMFFISSILLFITSLLFHEGLPHISSFSNFIIVIIILAAIFNVANMFLINYGFQKVQAVLASNLLMLTVLFAVFISVVFYKEIPTFKELIGGLLIIFSAYRMNQIST